MIMHNYNLGLIAYTYLCTTYSVTCNNYTMYHYVKLVCDLQSQFLRECLYLFKVGLLQLHCGVARGLADQSQPISS